MNQEESSEKLTDSETEEESSVEETAPETIQVEEPEESKPTDSYSSLESVRARSVRLVISIPVLILLLVLGSGLIIHRALMNLASENELLIVQRNIERAADYTLVLFSVISVVAGIIGLLVTLQIVRPIRELSESMKMIASGDFSLKTPKIQLGELGELGHSFNRMVEQLNHLFEERDRQIKSSFDGAHLILSPDGVVLRGDHSIKRILGVNLDELLQKNLLSPASNIPVVNRNPALLETLMLVIEASRKGTAMNRTLPIKDGKKKESTHYLISCLPIHGDDSEGMSLLLEMRDISGMVNFYEQIQRADRLAAIGTLATGIAHEIRNPLASIRGMSQLISEMGGDGVGDSNSAQLEYSTRIIKEVDRLENLVNAIMDFAQTEESAAEELDIHDLILEVLDSVRLQLGEKANVVEITTDFDPQMPICVLQSNKVRQGLLNIVLNAYQYCIEHQTGPIGIRSIYLPVNKQRPVCICFSNPSRFLSAEERERLFEPFYTTKPQGTGLGIPIAYQTVAANGGVLEVEYEDGEIQFWVRLPRNLNTVKSGGKLVPVLETPTPVNRSTIGMS